MTEFILPALSELMNPPVLIAIFSGTVIGIIVGAIPGLTATMAVALLIPVTFSMAPLVGLSLMGVYSGGMFGGAISAILLSTPEPRRRNLLDGYPMTKQGKGGRLKWPRGPASGGIISTLALPLMAPALASFP